MEDTNASSDNKSFKSNKWLGWFILAVVIVASLAAYEVIGHFVIQNANNTSYEICQISSYSSQECQYGPWEINYTTGYFNILCSSSVPNTNSNPIWEFEVLSNYSQYPINITAPLNNVPYKVYVSKGIYTMGIINSTSAERANTSVNCKVAYTR